MGFDLGRAVAKGLKRTGLGGALLGGGAAALYWQLFKRPLPTPEGDVSIRGLEGPVEIARDRWGMPRIRAATPHDLWFGQGFVHAQDRLWQCDLTRRVTAGRISEMAGEDGLQLDRLMRTLGLRRLALAEEAALPADVRSQLDAYCAGFNAAVASNTGPLPAEFQMLRLDFEPWRPADLLAGAKLLSFGLSTNWERELLRGDLVRELGPDLAERIDPTYPVHNPVVLEPGVGYSGDGASLASQIGELRKQAGMAGAAGGSNNWAVSPERSVTDGPLIAGDPHLPTAMPGIWHQNALELGDRFCRGATLPGIPGITMGQNNDVAWTFTNVMADVEDLFVERLDGDRYEFEGEWHDMELVDEEIAVKGRSPEKLTVRLTRHGPIVNDALGTDSAEPLALRWIATDFPGIGRGHLEIFEPTTGPELVDLLEDLTMPVSNLIWADRHGSIGYKAVGRIPIRKGKCPDLPKPGWVGDFEWDGAVPYGEMPESIDPDAGFLVTANNRIEGDGFPHHISSDYLDGFRARRIEQLIGETPEHDLDGFRRMQTDLYSIPGDQVARRLARIDDIGGQREVAAVERLKSWDRRLGPDTIAGTIYQAFLLRLATDFARAAIGDRDLAERWLDRSDSGFTTHVTSPWRWHAHLLDLWEEADEELIGRPWDELAAGALRGALDDLERRFGPDQEAWRWGRVHELRFPHALGDANSAFEWAFNRTLHPGGAQETIAQVAYDPNDPYHAIWAPSWRMVADPMAPERSMWQAFTGQSGQPFSPHYDDLQPRWMAGQMQPMEGEGPWDTLTLTPA